jgi:hypothetical protein
MEPNPSRMEPVEFALKIQPILELEEFERLGCFSWRWGFSANIPRPQNQIPDSARKTRQGLCSKPRLVCSVIQPTTFSHRPVCAYRHFDPVDVRQN